MKGKKMKIVEIIYRSGLTHKIGEDFLSAEIKNIGGATFVVAKMADGKCLLPVDTLAVIQTK